MVHKIFHLYIICLCAKFCTLISSISLVITIKLIGKYRWCAVATLLFCTLQKLPY